MQVLKTHLLVPSALLAFLFLFSSCSSTSNKGKEQSHNLSVPVKNGEFKIYVTATGELKAKNSEQIKGPPGMRGAQIYNATISDMVPEGTVVKAGGYVATLDRTELQTKLKEAQTEIDKIQTQLDQAKIDTAIELRGIRDDLINMQFAMEEKKLQVEQSRYEPQMVIQQAEIDLEKAARDYKQLGYKYELTQTKSIAKISEIMASLRQEQIKRQRFVDLSANFTIKAPKDGMVIYARSWNGKVGPGSQISTWNPVVAELPDLSIMISKSYVNEVDISKVQKGQDVQVKVDAFPDREYSGSVIQVANVGEQLRGYDSKVFEVTVRINEVDSILRPAMTTSNEILTYTFPQVLYIPLEALQNDTIAYVFKKEGGKIVRQEVLTSETNDNEVIIEHGLKEGEEVLLTVPDNAEKLPLKAVDPKIKADIKKRLKEEKKKRMDEALKKMNEVKDEYQPKNEGGGNVIIFG
ncbi:MAG TPA: HlyD family efflux transporter periplasmic adaptor subunit [Bacteroidetes bacterium]|nr:HlyD family efflux transporter periplasmic adaptor subunit [Bacteroidota bacterium]